MLFLGQVSYIHLFPLTNPPFPSLTFMWSPEQHNTHRNAIIAMLWQLSKLLMSNAEDCGNVYFIVLFSADRSSFDSIKSLVRVMNSKRHRIG